MAGVMGFTSVFRVGVYLTSVPHLAVTLKVPRRRLTFPFAFPSQIEYNQAQRSSSLCQVPLPQLEGP